MEKHVLRKALWEILRPLMQLVSNLLNPEKGEEWEREFKKFLRKEECWKKQFVDLDSESVTLIDCDSKPFMVREGWSIKEHRKCGKVEWNPKKVFFHLSESQTSTHFRTNLLKTLENKPVLNACVLDYLLANPCSIPDDWKDRSILFLGTTYLDWSGHLCARCLYWDWKDNKWKSGVCWASSIWDLIIILFTRKKVKTSFSVPFGVL